jgi:hypothetical protein
MLRNSESLWQIYASDMIGNLAGIGAFQVCQYDYQIPKTFEPEKIAKATLLVKFMIASGVVIRDSVQGFAPTWFYANATLDGSHFSVVQFVVPQSRNPGIIRDFPKEAGRVSLQSRLAGGESGIRTHVTLSSKHAFQACAFSHSAISPALWEELQTHQWPVGEARLVAIFYFMVRRCVGANTRIPCS